LDYYIAQFLLIEKQNLSNIPNEGNKVFNPKYMDLEHIADNHLVF